MMSTALAALLLCSMTALTYGQNTNPPCNEAPAGCLAKSRTDCKAMNGDDYCCGIGFLWETVECRNGTSYEQKRFCCKQSCSSGGYCRSVASMSEPCYNYYGNTQHIMDNEDDCWDMGCCWDADNPFGIECYQRHYNYMYSMVTCSEVYPDCDVGQMPENVP